MAKTSNTARKRVAREAAILRKKGKSISEAMRAAWRLEKAGKLAGSKKSTMARRRRTTTRRRRRATPNPRRRVIRSRASTRRRSPRRRTTRAGMRRKTARRAYARRNPRGPIALIQSEAAQIGLAAVIGSMAAAQLQNMADAENGMAWLSPTLGTTKIPAGVIGSAAALLVAANTKNAKTRKVLVGGAAGMLAPAAIGLLQNPRALQGPSYRRLARPTAGRTVYRTGNMVNTARSFRLSTVPA